MKRTFQDVKVGETFQANGITAVKHSSRTGKLSSGRIFYWGQKESVIVTKHNAVH
ncbi:hypothetical protein [Pseudomonas phage vB_PseuGesM_254]|uniref:Uncharacterized protein n=1 Tax=Pseudomonas phage vB_PseuGesM_254 TaxID=3092638 RepID=A0AAX4G7X7_9CAUD|nr:hypothetical protein [Pseudomonas phage PseuGes_254]